MKIFIPSWGRPATICTHKLIDGYGYNIVVHSREDALWYAKNPSIKPGRLVTSGLGYGHAAHRNWVLNNLVKDGEWIVMADDNITGLWRVQEPWYNQDRVPTETMDSRFWHNAFQHPMSWKVFMEKLVSEDIPEAEKRGAKLIGYATNTSPLFRKNKYRDVGYVKGKLFAMKKTSLRMDENLLSKVDFEFTAANLYHIGRVLINNFIFPVAPHFAKGGIGTVHERTPLNLFGCKYLMEKYPGLFAYETKPGRQNFSEVRFKITSLAGIEKWQKSFSPSEKKLLAFLKGKAQE